MGSVYCTEEKYKIKDMNDLHLKIGEWPRDPSDVLMIDPRRNRREFSVEQIFLKNGTGKSDCSTSSPKCWDTDKEAEFIKCYESAEDKTNNSSRYYLYSSQTQGNWFSRGYYLDESSEGIVKSSTIMFSPGTIVEEKKQKDGWLTLQFKDSQTWNYDSTGGVTAEGDNRWFKYELVQSTPTKESKPSPTSVPTTSPTTTPTPSPAEPTPPTTTTPAIFPTTAPTLSPTTDPTPSTSPTNTSTPSPKTEPTVKDTASGQKYRAQKCNTENEFLNCTVV